MNIQTEKLNVIDKIRQTNKEAIIDQIKAILEDDGQGQWDELPQHVQQAIERSEEQIKKGEVKLHETFFQSLRSDF